MRVGNREARRRWAAWSAVLVWGLAAVGSAAEPVKDACQNHGTVIRWMSNAESAWRLASDEIKPVFLLHVSGNFAKQDFT